MDAPDPHVTDEDRERLAAEIAAALALIYQHHAQRAYARLKRTPRALHQGFRIQHTLNAKASEVAGSVQRGVNTRIANAQVDPENPDAVAQSQQAMDTYNAKTLVPYLTAWAAQQALSDVYADTPSPTPGLSMRDAVNWVWTQVTDNPDDCADAAAASPASYNQLVGIGGGEPPVHRNCQCSLDPDD